MKRPNVLLRYLMPLALVAGFAGLAGCASTPGVKSVKNDLIVK